MAQDKITAAEIFGEEWERLTLHSFPIRDGVGYYVPYESMGADRRPATHYRIKLIWTNGETEETTAASPGELALWTDHLK